jgi:arylsulfatase
MLINLRSDPFERASDEGSLFYDKWAVDRAFALVPAQAAVAAFLKTFEEFPPRQRPASFSISDALEKVRESEKAMKSAGSQAA